MSVPQSYLNYILNNKIEPSANFKYELLQLTGYTLQELVDGAYRQHDYKWLLDRKGHLKTIPIQFPLTSSNLIERLATQERINLKHKLFIEIDHLEKQIDKKQLAFEKQFKQVDIYMQEVACIKLTLTKAQANLEYLQQSNAPTELINTQTGLVRISEQQLIKLQQKNIRLQPETLVSFQLEIESLHCLLKFKRRQYEMLY